MKKAKVFYNRVLAGFLIEEDNDQGYLFIYEPDYQGMPISLTMPVQSSPYSFKTFPPFFDGLLPEGPQLEALLRQTKLDRQDYLGQLIKVGADLVGAVTIMGAS